VLSAHPSCAPAFIDEDPLITHTSHRRARSTRNITGPKSFAQLINIQFRAAKNSSQLLTLTISVIIPDSIGYLIKKFDRIPHKKNIEYIDYKIKISQFE